MTQTGLIQTILRRPRRAAQGDRTSVGAVVEAMGSRSHTAVLLLVALLIVTPLSGIPGASSVGGILIALVSAQILAGRRYLWLPARLQRVSLPSDRRVAAIDWLDRPARWIDSVTRRRAVWLVRGPGRMALASLCLIGGMLMPLLELVPFSSTLIASAVSLFATALIVRDGLVAAAGLAVAGGLAALATTALA